jgi:hypothetical protein
LEDIWNINYQWTLTDNIWTKQPVFNQQHTFDINNSYFKYQKCLSGITYQYVNQLDNIYDMNIMVGTNYCLYCMYNEFDIINNFMVNLYNVDVCSTSELDLTNRYFKIDNANLRTGHRVLLVAQTDTTQNDVYNVDSRGYLILSDEFSDTGKTWRYKAYVKLGDNKGKQFHLKNVGNRFPLTGEKKEFLDGHAYIIKNIFNYNINDTTSIIPKLIFTDYEIARLSVNKNYELYSGFTFNSLKSGGYFKIKYHDYEYNVTIDNDTSKFTYTGVTSGTTVYNILNGDYKIETWVLTDSTIISNINTGDYIKLTISGDTNLVMYSYVIGTSGNNVRLKDYIDQFILNNIYSGSTTYEFTNLMYSDETNVNNRILQSYYSKYFTIEDGTPNYLYPIQYDYNRYFDYDGLSFDINSNQCTISGNITGSVIYNALVTNGTDSTYSDINGDYSLTLPLGVQTITVSYSHYYNTGVTLTLVDENPITIDFAMTHYTGITLGTVTDSWTGSTISGVTITGSTIILGTTYNYYKTTDSSGYFYMGSKSGDYTFTFSHPTFITKTTGVTVPDDGTLTLNMTLDYTPVPPTVITTDITFLDQTGVTLGGDVTLSGWTAVTSRGVAYGTSINPTIDKTIDGSGTGTYTSTITGLTAGTSYYARAYATNIVNTSYGSNSGFTTTADIPIVTTTSISLITDTGATSGGIVVNECGSSVTFRGICWNTGGTPTILDNSTTDGTGLGSFTSVMTGLTSGSTYYVRAYATNGIGTAYGSELSFVSESLPIVVTTPISAAYIFDTYAYGGGDVTSVGSTPVTARGICWDIYPNDPTISDPHTTDGTGFGPYSSTLSPLLPLTTYNIRAYATNSSGTAYGTFMESIVTIDLPTVTGWTSVTNLTHTGATYSGEVINTGTATTTRGICYSTSSNPTILNDVVDGGSGLGVFVCDMTGLTQGSTYYVRAFATNQAGTTYGINVSFVPVTLPTVITSSISSLTSTTLTAGGNVTNDGGTTVTDRGVCYSGVTLPTVCSASGSGTGLFTKNITGLSAGNTYYVRAYATNSVGTVYGDYSGFTTTVGVGSLFGGGIVFYVGGGYALISSLNNQGLQSWGCNGTYLGVTGNGYGVGDTNTNTIVGTGCGSVVGTAAKTCYDLNESTYTDWYLPSKMELQEMYVNRAIINAAGNTLTSYYWSSTEYDSNSSYVVDFTGGTGSWTNGKTDTSTNVRPIRKVAV